MTGAGVLTERQAAFVERQRVAHLATADAEGRPHVVRVCFVQREGKFYISIDEKPKRSVRLRRLRNIEANPSVALVFDHYSDDWEELGYVLVFGRASVLTSGAEYEAALAGLRERYAQYRSQALEGRPLVRIEPERVASWGRLG